MSTQERERADAVGDKLHRECGDKDAKKPRQHDAARDAEQLADAARHQEDGEAGQHHQDNDQQQKVRKPNTIS